MHVCGFKYRVLHSFGRAAIGIAQDEYLILGKILFLLCYVTVIK